MRPALIIALCLGALVLCVGGGYAWQKVLWRTGAFKTAPALAKGMFPQPGAVSPSWSRRLRQAYPVGSAEAVMLTGLKKQGFEVDAERKRAAYGWAAYPCVYTLTVSWRADGLKRLRDVTGGLHNACTDPSKLIPERPTRRRGSGTDGPQGFPDRADSA